MTAFRKVAEVRVDVYDASGALVTQVGSDIDRIEMNEVADRSADDVSIRVVNYLGRWSNVFDLNQELRLFVRYAGESSLTHVWTGLIDSMESERDLKNRSVIKLQANDFVFRIMGDQEVSYAFVAKDAATALAELCTSYAPEIDTSLLTPVGVNVTILANGQTLLEAAKEIARRADCTFYGDAQKRLHFETRGSVSSGVTITGAKVAHVRPQKHRPEANVVRVWGGDTTVLGANQPIFSSFTTVTSATRKTAQFRASKSRVATVSLWTEAALPSGSQDDLIVRIQADNGSGAPTNVADSNFDLSRKVISKDKLTEGGWTDFQMSDNMLGAGTVYWLIVESSSTSGRNVGVNGAGDIVFKVYHPTPIIVERSNQGSIDTYRRIVKTIRRRQIESDQEARDLADSELARAAYARWEVELDVVDTALSAVPIGQNVTLSLPDDGLSGAYVVTKKRSVFDSESSSFAQMMHVTQRDMPQTLVSAIGAIHTRLTKVEDSNIGKNNSFLTDLFRAFAESFKLNDAAATTVGTPGSYTVGPDAAEAEIGFSDIE